MFGLQGKQSGKWTSGRKGGGRKDGQKDNQTEKYIDGETGEGSVVGRGRRHGREGGNAE